MKLKRWIKWGLAAVVLGFFLLALAVRLFLDFDFEMKPEQARAYFAARKLQPHFKTHQFGDRPIHHVSVGDPGKPLVVFVHGSPGSWDAFIGFLGKPSLLERARLVSVDRPGFGGSGRHRHEPSLQRQAAALQPILENAQHGKGAILVGHSLGGPVIARMAMDYPHLVAGLIMVAPSIDPQLEKTKWYQIPADWKLFSWMVPKVLVTTNREILPLKGELETMLPLWASITQPVTVIQGEKDRLVPPGNADFAKRVLTTAPLTTVRIPDLNHFVPWRRPDLIEKAILNHLEALEKSTSQTNTTGQ